MNPRRLLSLLLVPALATTATTATFAVEKPVLVSARLHCLSLGDSLSDLALIDAKGGRLPIDVPNSFLSQVYEYKGPATAVVARTDVAASAPAVAPVPTVAAVNPTRSSQPRAAAGVTAAAGVSSAPPAPINVAATFQLPPEGGEFLLLFAPGADNALRVAPLDFSPRAVPSGYYLVWNISSERLAFSFGAKNLVIEPGQSQLMTPGAGEDTYVPLRVFDEHAGKPRLIVSGRHFNRANARQIFLFSSAENPSAPVRMQAITSLLPTPNASVAAAAAGTKVASGR